MSGRWATERAPRGKLRRAFAFVRRRVHVVSGEARKAAADIADMGRSAVGVANEIASPPMAGVKDEAQFIGQLLAEVASETASRLAEHYFGKKRTVDPIPELINGFILKGANALIECKKDLAVSIAHERKLARQAEQEAANAAEWERRAILAAKSGDDALTKEALGRKNEHAVLARTLTDESQQHKGLVEQHKMGLLRLNEKVEEAKRLKAAYLARRRRDEMRRSVDEATQTLEEELAALDRACRIMSE